RKEAYAVEQEQRAMLDKIREGSIAHTEASMDHWLSYSHMGAWQFWVCVAALLLPLVVLLMRLDRRRTFQILFFGFVIHALMNYIDSYAVGNGSVVHP